MYWAQVGVRHQLHSVQGLAVHNTQPRMSPTICKADTPSTQGYELNAQFGRMVFPRSPRSALGFPALPPNIGRSEQVE